MWTCQCIHLSLVCHQFGMNLTHFTFIVMFCHIVFRLPWTHKLSGNCRMEDLKCSKKCNRFDITSFYHKHAGELLRLFPAPLIPPRCTSSVTSNMSLCCTLRCSISLPHHNLTALRYAAKHWQKRCKDKKRYFCNFLSSFGIQLVYDIV